jgi:Cu2+-exporting ATPase
MVSLVLSLPLFIYFAPRRALRFSPVTASRTLAGAFGFLLATPVVWWRGIRFISAAWRALRRGEVNMMTLIALGHPRLLYHTRWRRTFIFEGKAFYEAAGDADDL